MKHKQETVRHVQFNSITNSPEWAIVISMLHLNSLDYCRNWIRWKSFWKTWFAVISSAYIEVYLTKCARTEIQFNLIMIHSQLNCLLLFILVSNSGEKSGNLSNAFIWSPRRLDYIAFIIDFIFDTILPLVNSPIDNDRYKICFYPSLSTQINWEKKSFFVA